ncbi:MAG TPA: GNAT family N-acetyltransferase, partial [Candidatus Polarisedimenticolia bacterium]|nr:GNAT family N-acetyltransferase [Candidatus Polarisedimenticolia bacterium]
MRDPLRAPPAAAQAAARHEPLEGLRPEWDELLAGSQADGPFLTWEWIEAWTRHLLPGGEPGALAVRRGGRLIGVAPLMPETRRAWGLLEVPGLKFLGTGIAGPDYLDVIALRGLEPQVAGAVASAVAGDAGWLEMGQVREGPAVADGVAGLLARRGWTVAGRTLNVCPYIPLEGSSWESYLADLGREHRYGIHRKLRRLDRTFAVSLRIAASHDERRQALRHLLDLHGKRWETRGGSDAFGGRALEDFHEEFTRRALDRGWLRLLTLSLDGMPAASLYGLSYKGIFYFYQSGLEPRFARHSTGLVIMAHAIQAALKEGAREFDMLHGAESYKFHWARRTRAI